MNELIERLNEMSRVMTHSDGVVTTTVARLLTYQESYEATGLCREAADTLLALQTQLAAAALKAKEWIDVAYEAASQKEELKRELERVERETDKGISNQDMWNLVDRALKMFEQSYSVIEHNTDDDNPIKAWMADARIALKATEDSLKQAGAYHPK